MKRPVLVPVSAHGSGSERNCTLHAHDAPDDTDQVEDAARKPVDARDCHHVAGGKGVEHLEKLAPVRTGRLLVINRPAARASQPLKLRVERPPVSADAGVAEGTAELRHISANRNPLIQLNLNI